MPLAENRPSGAVSFIEGAGLLGLKQGGNFYYMLSDGLGSVRSIVDSSGNVVATNETDAYGVNLSNTGSAELRANTFTGALGVRDDGNGLYYARNRYYNPQLGRWLSRDPIGYSGGDLSLYGYVDGNPLRYVDPSGLGPIRFFVQTAKGSWRKIKGGYLQAIELMKRTPRGVNLKLEGATKNARRGEAKLVGKKSFGKDNILVHDPHPGDPHSISSHVQPKDRGKCGIAWTKGHIYFSLAIIASGEFQIPGSRFGEDNLGLVGMGLDMFNPLSDVQDAVDYLGKPAATAGEWWGELSTEYY